MKSGEGVGGGGWRHLKDGVLCDAEGCGLQGSSTHNVHMDGGAALGFQNIPCQVLAAEAAATPPVGVLSTQRATRLKAPQAPAQQHSEVQNRFGSS